MATSKSARRSARTRTTGLTESIQFSRVNWVLIGLGLAALLVGYALLARGSTVAAPLLLVLGYAVLVPLGIIR